MNEKEVSEIRRRYRPDKNNISHLHGCCVNEKREIIAQFKQSLNLMPEEEAERLLATLRRTLSGGLGRNLIDIEFTTGQVADSAEHKLLMSLRNSALEDAEAVTAFFQKAVESIDLEGSYLIFLVHDAYDVPFRSGDGKKQADASSEVFQSILCSVCPVKMAKPALRYFPSENEFHLGRADWLVAPPELGFLFPAFDDRSANLYNALYYSRSTAQSHPVFADAVFHCEPPMPAALQKETFQAILTDSLGEDCSYGLVQTVHEQVREILEIHKESKEPEPPVITKETVRQLLESCGASAPHVAAFEQKYDSEFGADAALSPQNLVEAKRFALATPDVTINVNPDRSDLVDARVIDGAKYIVVRVEEGVEVNGVPIRFPQPETQP